MLDQFLGLPDSHLFHLQFFDKDKKWNNRLYGGEVKSQSHRNIKGIGEYVQNMKVIEEGKDINITG